MTSRWAIRQIKSDRTDKRAESDSIVLTRQLIGVLVSCTFPTLLHMKDYQARSVLKTTVKYLLSQSSTTNIHDLWGCRKPARSNIHFPSRITKQSTCHEEPSLPWGTTPRAWLIYPFLFSIDQCCKYILWYRPKWNEKKTRKAYARPELTSEQLGNLPNTRAIPVSFYLCFVSLRL